MVLPMALRTVDTVAKCGRSKSDTCEVYLLNWCSQLTVGDVEGKLKPAIKCRDIVVWIFLMKTDKCLLGKAEVASI